jgi:PAS domain S-box-containing protein
MPSLPKMTNTANNFREYISGGGEMGSLIRSYDWNATSVGPIEDWPQSLLTTVSIIIHSKFPMFLFWGEELLCFYNDAYRPSLGNDAKHPSALGRPAAEVWPEIWPVIKPLIDQVLAGDEATWSEDQLIPIYRNGTMENVYWTFSYSAVYAETGTVGGVFVTCSETTKAVQNLHTLEEHKNELHFAIEAAELATWDFNPATNKFTANDRLKDWFGLPPGNELDLSFAMAAIAEKDRQMISDAIVEVLTPGSDGHYEREYSLIHPITQAERIVSAKGKAWFNEENVAYKFNGTIQDVSEQVRSRYKIEENEHLLSQVIQESPVRITFLEGPDMKVRLVNEIVLKSWRKDRSVIGMPLREVLPELENQPFLKILDEVYHTGIAYCASGSEARFMVKGKPVSHYFDIWYKPIADATGKIYGILATSMEVTEKVLAGKRIAESEQRFRNVVESAPFPIGVYTGEELKIQLANQVMLDTWGKGNEVIGKLYTEILPELENSEIFGQLRSVLKTGIPFHAKNTRVDIVIDGILKPFYFNYSFTPLYDSTGNIYGVMNTAADVTDVNVANMKVEQSENNLRNTILQSPVAMCILKGNDHLVEIANERMLELWGKKYNEMVGKKLVEGLEEIKGQGFDLLLDHVYTTGETYRASDVPVVLPRESGMETVYVDFVYEAFRAEDGSISGVIVVATDVTEQFVARHLIEQAEESARLAIESAELGKYEINLVTDEIKASDRFNEIWGVTHPIPRAEYACFIHPNDRGIRTKAHKEAIETGNLDYEARLVWTDKSIHWVRVKGKVIYDENNKPVSLLGVIQDITEQKEFSEELKKQVSERTAELHRSNDDLLHFAHVASHDLKEPVRKVKVFSNMIAEEFGDLLPERGVNYLNKVQNATDRMFSMIDGVLSYSTLNAGDQSIEKISLIGIIQNIESDLEVLISKKEAVIKKDCLPEIEGAAVLVYQLFYNLINNSLKFSKEGRKPLIVFHCAEITKDDVLYAEITIADNGIGLDQQYAEQIFHPFARLNAKDQYEGTGLGLALCKKIVERHHGSIFATGVKDEGAVFTILLPLKQPQKII